MSPHPKKLVLPALVMFASLSTSLAHAALTDSEKAQIQGFIRGGDVANARRVRSLIARPDLTREEAAAPLIAGFGPVPFDEKHAAFAKELLVGPGSTAARSEIAPALVKALLGRANQAMASAGPESDKATNELLRIHRFVSDVIANAGKPAADGHDAAAGFRDDALKAAFESYKQHLEQNAKDPKQSAPAHAQSALAMIDLGRGIVGRRDMSAALGVTGARQTAFERHGTFIETCGKSNDARMSTVGRWLDASPGAAGQLGFWAICKTPLLGMKSRGEKASARVAIDASSTSDSELWPPDVVSGATDRELSEIAYSLALVIAKDALKKAPELRRRAARVAERAERAGGVGYLSKDLPESVIAPIGATAETSGAHGVAPELFVAHALRLVLVDARRATDLALARNIDGRGEPAAALVLALSALAVENPGTKELIVGRTLADGKIETFSLANVSSENNVVTGYKIDKDAVELALDSEGAISKAKLNGAEPKLGKLAFARALPKAGDSFQLGKQKLEKLSGAPRVAVLDDGRVVLAPAEKTNGFDALALGTAASDQSVRAWIKPGGRGGGLLVRGQAGEKSYDGIALLISGGATPKAQLILADGKAHATELAPPIDLPAAGPDGYAVGLSVKGQAVTATIDDKKIEATLTRAAGSGRIGLVVAVSGSIEASDLGAGLAKDLKKRAAPKEKPPEKKAPEKKAPEKKAPEKKKP